MARGDRGGTTHGFPAVPGDQLPSGGFANFRKPPRVTGPGRGPGWYPLALPGLHATPPAQPATTVSRRPVPASRRAPVVTTKITRRPAPAAGKRGGPPSRNVGATVDTDPYAVDDGSPTGLENAPTSVLLELAKQHGIDLEALTGAYGARRTAAQQRLDAVLAQLNALPAQVGADYDAAIAKDAQLGQVSGQLLAQANPNAQAQADLAAIGAPSAQQQQVAGNLNNAFAGAGAVLAHVGGVIPAQSLNEQKAAQIASFRALPIQARQQFNDNMAELDAQLADDKAKLEHDYFNQRISAQQYETELTQKQQAAAEDARRYSQEYALKVAGLKQNEAVIRSQIGDRAFNQQVKAANVGLAKARVGLQGQSLAVRQLQNNRQWQATLQRLGIQDKGLQLRAAQLELNARNKKKSKQPSAADLQEMADLAYYGTADKTDSNGNVTYGKKAVDYQTALFGMMNQGVPLAVAQRYLNQFYAPGEDGRPRVPYQQRQKRPKRR
jgi:hypothetical protein